MRDAVIINYQLFLYNVNFVQKHEKKRKQCFLSLYIADVSAKMILSLLVIKHIKHNLVLRFITVFLFFKKDIGKQMVALLFLRMRFYFCA